MDNTATGFKRSSRTNKPMIEKRRRDRINACLLELKSMVVNSRNKLVIKPSKLEKADILELTVKFLQDLMLCREPGTMPASAKPSFYAMGYQTCISEVSRYLESNSDLSNPDKCQILSRLKERARLKTDTDRHVESTAVVDEYPLQDHSLVAATSAGADVYTLQDHTMAGVNRQQPIGIAEDEPENQTEVSPLPEFVQTKTAVDVNVDGFASASGVAPNSALLNFDQSAATKTPPTNVQNQTHQMLYMPPTRETQLFRYEDNGECGTIQAVQKPQVNCLIALNLHSTINTSGDGILSLPYVIAGQLSVAGQGQICHGKKETDMKKHSTTDNCTGCVGKSVGKVPNMDKNSVWRPW